MNDSTWLAAAGVAMDGALAGGGMEANRIRDDAEELVEFELMRLPDRCDTRIARVCGTDVIMVRQVRDRLGAYPTRPV